jgi:hypothetical protein
MDSHFLNFFFCNFSHFLENKIFQCVYGLLSNVVGNGGDHVVKFCNVYVFRK